MQNTTTQHATVQIFKKDDKTFDTENMSAASRWSYYISSFVMRDWTEGVPHNIQWPFLRRNLPNELDSEAEYGKTYLPQWNEDGLVVRIAANNYRILYDPGTTDWWVHDEKVRMRGSSGAEELKMERKKKFMEKFSSNTAWMAAMGKDEVDEIRSKYTQWVNDGSAAPKESAETASTTRASQPEA